jgi:hypothetical protein
MRHWTPFTVIVERSSIGHAPMNVASAGETMTTSLRGSSIGRLPDRISRAKNWLKVCEPLGPTK